MGKPKHLKAIEMPAPIKQQHDQDKATIDQPPLVSQETVDQTREPGVVGWKAV
jgi:hypothetical protein